MPPNTRSQTRPTTPERPISTADYSTKTRTEFFRDYDTATLSKTMASIYRLFSITNRTGRRWLRRRRELGSPAIYRTRTLATNLGRQSKVSKETLKMLVSLSRNLV